LTESYIREKLNLEEAQKTGGKKEGNIKLSPKPPEEGKMMSCCNL